MTRDLRAEIAAISAQARLNQWLGLEVVRAEPGEVDIAIQWRDELGQYSGFLHAGIIGGLIDTACGFAAVTLVGRVLASHYSVNCLAPAVGVGFQARGIVIKPGRRQVFTRGDLWALDSSGVKKLVATGETLMMRVD